MTSLAAGSTDEQVWGRVSDVVHTVVNRQPDVPLWLILLAAVAAAAAVLVPAAWPVSRNVVTIAHEGGHALIAGLVGRKLAGIRLHSDTSGVTVSAGRPTGPGMVATAFAGYTAPAFLGAAGVAALSHDRVAAVLWGVTLALAAMMLLIRNVYGAGLVFVAGVVVVPVTLWAGVLAQASVAYLLVWFLILAAIRPVWELHQSRRAGRAAENDADQLAALTGVPGVVWEVLFAAAALAAAVYAVNALVLHR